MKKRYKFLISVFVFFAIGYLIPERIRIPVSGATEKDWNPESFWYEPWGTSGVHKGIDIFGKMGADVVSTTDGLVLYTGQLKNGGNVILMLGPKWRFHYFAHLRTINTERFKFVASGTRIATLGDSGNARGKPAHLHYSIARFFPEPWFIDSSTQGFKKAFFMDPGLYLKRSM